MDGIRGNINWIANAEKTLGAHRLPTRLAGKLRKFAVPIEAEVERKVPERQGARHRKRLKGSPASHSSVSLTCQTNTLDGNCSHLPSNRKRQSKRSWAFQRGEFWLPSSGPYTPLSESVPEISHAISKENRARREFS